MMTLIFILRFYLILVVFGSFLLGAICVSPKFSCGAKGKEECSTFDANVCSALKEKFRSGGVLDEVQANVYCASGCNFIRGFTCSRPDDDPLGFNFDASGWFKGLVDEADDLSDDWLSMDISDGFYTLIIGYFSPWILSIIPCIIAMLCGVKDKPARRGLAMMLSLVFCSVHTMVFFRQDMASVAFAYLVAFQSSFALVQIRLFYDIASIFFVVVLQATIGLFIDDVYGQIALGFGCIAIFCIVLYKKFAGSGNKNFMDIVGLLLTFKMVSGYIATLFNKMAYNRPGLLFVRHFTVAAFPYGNKHKSLWNNILHESSHLISSIEMNHEGRLPIFIFGFFSYIFVFIIIRTVIGMAVLRTIRADLTFSNMAIGLYAYCVDVINPFMAVWKGMYDKDARRFLYAMVMIAYNVGEFAYAREVLMFRVLLMILDWVVIGSGLVNAQRFLDYDVELNGLVFEKPGALPFAFLDSLVKVKECVVDVYSDMHDASGQRIQRNKGVGLIRSISGNKSLFTVRHVLDQKHIVSTDDGLINEQVGMLTTLGHSIDPPVQMTLLRCEAEGCSVRNVSRTELRHVKYLFMVSTSGAICPIPDFRIDYQNGDIHAAVNVKCGDSGTPIVGILNTGQMVLMGAVSRGDSREGALNLISSIFHTEQMSGSPGTMQSGYMEANISSTLNESLISDLKRLIEEDRYERLAIAVTWPNLQERPGEVVEKILDWRNEMEPEPKAEPKDPDISGAAWNKRGKNRIKSYRKDRAARKRAYMSIARALCVDDASLDVLSQAFDDRKIVKFNRLRRRTVQGFTNSDW